MKKGLELKLLEWMVFVIVMVILFFSTQTYFATANYSRIYHTTIHFSVCSIGIFLYDKSSSIMVQYYKYKYSSNSGLFDGNCIVLFIRERCIKGCSCCCNNQLFYIYCYMHDSVWAFSSFSGRVGFNGISTFGST